MVKNNQKIPDGWSVKKLEECFSFLRTPSYSRAETTDSGDVHYIHYGDIHTKYPLHVFPKDIDIYVSNDQAQRGDLLKTGDLILLDASEDYEGTTKCIELMDVKDNDKIIAGLHTLALRDNANYFTNGFRAYITSMPFVKINFWKQVSGFKVYGVSKDNLKKLKLLLPPLAEQEKIAGILGTWDEAIEKLSDLIEQKKFLKKGLMQRLLTGKIRLPGFTQPWKEVKLGEIADLYQSQTISQEMLVDTGYPVYGANGFIGYFHKCNHDTWQIMITCRGSTCGTVNRTSGPSWITGNAMVINCDTYEICKLFLYYKLLLENFSSVISGSGQPQIVRSPLLKWKVNIPSDISEQQAIADVLSTADDEINLLNQKLEALKEQKKGLMQQLLTGQIRVKLN